MKRFSSKLTAYFWLARLNRTVMVAVVTGAAAFVAGAGVLRSLWMTLAGWCLATGGFSMDFYADRNMDSAMRHRIHHNPLADGSLSPTTGLVFSLTFIAVSFVITVLSAPRALVPWSIVLLIIIGLALHLFETPVARALTLGLLQALYLFMGGAAGTLSRGLYLLAGTLFFAMLGGRGMVDIRDFLEDTVTDVQTMPKRFGMKRTVIFITICLHIAYLLSLAAYFTGEFTIVYLYFIMALIIIGLISTWLFATRPSPTLAYFLTPVFMMLQGTLLVLGMVLGSL
ncbi:MAG: UbiA family prenyltransferase [candidate division WOR-3 bacterium]|nr:MAG: UbiA family prenyltransferase [candidate division WOR-3 bacterium]